jgi:hypothetical protein
MSIIDIGTDPLVLRIIGNLALPTPLPARPSSLAITRRTRPSWPTRSILVDDNGVLKSKCLTTARCH